jgi:hypothetical protein
MFRRRSSISEQHPRHRAVLDRVSVRRRFTASSFRFWGSATSGRLGRVTVLPQLKVDRLCSVVDGTAEFDPKPTLAGRQGPVHAPPILLALDEGDYAAGSSRFGCHLFFGRGRWLGSELGGPGIGAQMGPNQRSAWFLVDGPFRSELIGDTAWKASARASGSSTCGGQFGARLARQSCGSARGRELGRCGRRYRAAYRTRHAVFGAD